MSGQDWLEQAITEQKAAAEKQRALERRQQVLQAAHAASLFMASLELQAEISRRARERVDVSVDPADPSRGFILA